MPSVRSSLRRLKRLKVTYKKNFESSQGVTLTNDKPSKSALKRINRQKSRLFLLMRVVLHMTCPVRMDIQRKEIVVMEYMIGVQKVEPMLLEH